MGFLELGRRAEGYVTIQAEGIFLERFLNICMHRGLHIRNIRRFGAERLTADISISSFRRIRPVCFRTKTRVRILKRQGVPFLLHRYRKRKLALIGVCLALVLLWYTSGHIMGITVFGNEKIPTETVLQYLARSGVALGKSARNLDSSTIRNQMMRDLDELAWIGINVNGSRVYVEVVERLTPEPGVDKNSPCHLVAKKDGIVISIEAREGQSIVKPGSGVRQGDVLVSGIVDNTATGYRAVHAYGMVFANTTYQAEREYRLKSIEGVDTGNVKNRYTLRILEWEIPLYFGRKNPYENAENTSWEREYRIPVDSIPSLFVRKETYREQRMEEREWTLQEVLEMAEQELIQELEEKLPETAEVEHRELTHTLTEQGKVVVKMSYSCKEDIAEEVPIQTQHEEGNQEEGLPVG